MGGVLSDVVSDALDSCGPRCPERIEVLDHGFVELLDMMPLSSRMAPELRDRQLTTQEYAILTAARTSTGGEVKGYAKDLGLLRYLLVNRHTTPFEMVTFKFRMQIPIDAQRQFVRHRTLSISEYSTRYAEAIDAVYIPDTFPAQGGSGVSRQASGGALDTWPADWKYRVLPQPDACGVTDVRENDLGQQVAVLSEAEGLQAYLQRSRSEAVHDAKMQYADELALGVSREAARGILPMSNYTLLVWDLDLHNLLHFFGLRIHPHAQGEIKAYAQAVWDLIYPYVPHVLDIFRDIRMDGVQLAGSDVDALRAYIEGKGQLPDKLRPFVTRLGVTPDDVDTRNIMISQSGPVVAGSMRP